MAGHHNCDQYRGRSGQSGLRPRIRKSALQGRVCLRRSSSPLYHHDQLGRYVSPRSIVIAARSGNSTDADCLWPVSTVCRPTGALYEWRLFVSQASPNILWCGSQGKGWTCRIAPDRLTARVRQRVRSWSRWRVLSRTSRDCARCARICWRSSIARRSLSVKTGGKCRAKYLTSPPSSISP